ncbi:DUF1642 domain-containing protein [Lactococcus lactis]|uniref:DUF1642 domain-containing protein n=1 Tax=Lactococcus lactis TaxID=1358 RepID=UPI00223C03FF|nr:DUF1642 domain-containing protein [Lactococcus lactis]
MTKFEEELMATAKMIPTSDGNEIKFKTSSALYDYLLLSNGEAELYLESQLQQQALPVVPECVDKWYKFHMDGTFSAVITSYASDGADKPVIWLVQNGGMDLLCKMKLYGYTVEKPQLFYLRDELTGQFLAKDNQFKDKDRYFFWTGADPLTHSIGTAWKLTFTHQEIDSMQTGSYEQIEVKECSK